MNSSWKVTVFTQNRVCAYAPGYSIEKNVRNSIRRDTGKASLPYDYHSSQWTVAPENKNSSASEP